MGVWPGGYGAMPGGYGAMPGMMPSPYYGANPMAPIYYGFNPYEMDQNQMYMANNTPIMYTTLEDPS
jgi:hypothetical protein